MGGLLHCRQACRQNGEQPGRESEGLAALGKVIAGGLKKGQKR